MKVLVNRHVKNNNEESVTYPKKITCEKCNSELEYEKSDIVIGAYGCPHILCPLCNYDNLLYDEEEELILTKDNVKFPTHFSYTSKETGAVDVCNNTEIKSYINRAIAYFRKNKDEFCWYAATGNLIIFVCRYDGDENYWVVVADKHYDTYITFEKEDYK